MEKPWPMPLRLCNERKGKGSYIGDANGNQIPLVELIQALNANAATERAAGEVEESECPGEDCPMCNGEACNLCGAGCWNNAAPHCEHDVAERHESPLDEAQRTVRSQVELERQAETPAPCLTCAAVRRELEQSKALFEATVIKLAHSEVDRGAVEQQLATVRRALMDTCDFCKASRDDVCNEHREMVGVDRLAAAGSGLEEGKP